MCIFNFGLVAEGVADPRRLRARFSLSLHVGLVIRSPLFSLKCFTDLTVHPTSCAVYIFFGG